MLIQLFADDGTRRASQGHASRHSECQLHGEEAGDALQGKLIWRQITR